MEENQNGYHALICFTPPHLTPFASYIPLTIAAIQAMSAGNNTKQLQERLPYYSWFPFELDMGPSHLIAPGYQV